MIGKTPLNGQPLASVISPGFARWQDRGSVPGAPAPPLADLIRLGGEPDARPAQSSREQPLSAALRQIDQLVKLNTRLKAESALLAKSLARAHRFACHDALTGLPNRRLLADHFEQAAALARRKRNYAVLIFLDLDGFKDINDAIGHTAADRLLQQVALRLSSCVRGSDTACRYGGDEFVVLLPDIDRPEQAVAVCEHIGSQLALHYVIDDRPIQATASLGMATFPTDGTDCFELIRLADLAMYRNKGRRGRAEPAADQPTGEHSPSGRGYPSNPSAR